MSKNLKLEEIKNILSSKNEKLIEKPEGKESLMSFISQLEKEVKPKKNTIQTTVYIDEEVYQGLRLIHLSSGISITKIIDAISKKFFEDYDLKTIINQKQNQ